MQQVQAAEELWEVDEELELLWNVVMDSEDKIGNNNRVGGKRKFSSCFRFPTSHTTVRAVRHTAVPHCSVQFDLVVHKARVTCSA